MPLEPFGIHGLRKARFYHIFEEVSPSRKTLFCEAAVVTQVALLVVHDFNFHEMVVRAQKKCLMGKGSCKLSTN